MMHRRPFTDRRSPCWRRSRTRPSSPSRTPACSRSWSSATPSFRRATARSPRRWSSRPRRPRCCGSSRPRRPTSRRVLDAHRRERRQPLRAPIGAIIRRSRTTSSRCAHCRHDARRQLGDARRPARSDAVHGPDGSPGGAFLDGDDPRPGRSTAAIATSSRTSLRLAAPRHADHARDAAAPRRRGDRRSDVVRCESPAVHRAPDRAAGDVRGPGRHRHRERPAVRGAGAAQRRAPGEQPPGHRGAGAADRDGRSAARDRLRRRRTSQRVLDAIVAERRCALRVRTLAARSRCVEGERPSCRWCFAG